MLRFLQLSKLIMILSSRQALLVSASENREFFMFDPKTTAVLHKYRTQEHIMPHHVYYEHGQQIVAQQVEKTFVSVWNWDSQEVDVKISLGETMTAFCLSADGHYLYGGGSTGTVYLWELPSGLLLKKKTVHASAILELLPFRGNHIITVSKTEVKIWGFSALLIEEDSSPPLKQYTTVLDILAASQSRNVIVVLTRKNLTLLSGSLTTGQKELQLYQKVDYDFATALTLSNTSAFVGDAKGNIEVVELWANEEERVELHFRTQRGELQVARAKKKKVLNGSKHPVTCLAYVDTLAYLVSGHASGEVIVWSNYEIKKALHLFKSSVVGLTPIKKPSEVKIHQTAKIRPLNKYELGKDKQPLEILPLASDKDHNSGLNYESQVQHRNEEEEILDRMMSTLRQPQKLLREELASSALKKSKLLEANLHYFKLLVP